MSKKLVLFTFVWSLAMILFVGCGPPTIDCSSDKAKESSTARVRENLPPAQRNLFDESMDAIFFSYCEWGYRRYGGADDHGDTVAQYRHYIAGKTGQEIIQIAAAIFERKLAEKRKLEMVRLQSEINMLEDREIKADYCKQIYQLKIVSSEVQLFENNVHEKYPVFRFIVDNNTTHTISAVYFHTDLSDAPLQLHCIYDIIKYEIPGNLAPNTRHNCEFITKDCCGGYLLPRCSRLQVEVVQLDVTDGPSLTLVKPFTVEDKIHLENLKKQFEKQYGAN